MFLSTAQVFFFKFYHFGIALTLDLYDTLGSEC